MVEGILGAAKPKPSNPHFHQYQRLKFLPKLGEAGIMPPAMERIHEILRCLLRRTESEEKKGLRTILQKKTWRWLRIYT